MNSQIDYYDKGAILGLLLDLEIRKLSHNAKSLDDVMRALYAEFLSRAVTTPRQTFNCSANKWPGRVWTDFFARYVRGREEHDYNRALAVAGLRLDTSEASGGAKAAEKGLPGRGSNSGG